MVLRNSGRVGRRRFPSEVLRNNPVTGDFVFYARRENPYRIPIPFMQCSLIRSRSAFWLPYEVLRHIHTQCFVAPSYCASLHLLKVSPYEG